jgi:hypothetical protein
VFDELVAEAFASLLKEDTPVALRKNAICVFDDALECCGPGAHRYAPFALAAMMRELSTDSEARQPAIYGIGIVAQVRPPRDAPPRPPRGGG